MSWLDITITTIMGLALLGAGLWGYAELRKDEWPEQWG